jgi:hypothetical protein
VACYRENFTFFIAHLAMIYVVAMGVLGDVLNELPDYTLSRPRGHGRSQ